MQVNSVSSTQPVAKQAFGNRDLQRAYLEQFARLDDKALGTLAYQSASERVNDKKHKRITNALYYSIPLVAGLAAAARSPKIVTTVAKGAKKAGSKVVDLTRYGKLGSFLRTSVGWAATFLAVDAIFGTKRFLDKKVPDMKKFTDEHPIMSSLLTMGVAIGALIGLNKGAGKLMNKLVKKVPEKEVEKSMVSMAEKLNNNKFLNSVSKKLAKVPSAIKEFTKGVLDYSPFLLIFGSIAHSINHQNVKNREINKDFNQLKNAQYEVRSALEKADAIERAVEV